MNNSMLSLTHPCKNVQLITGKQAQQPLDHIMPIQYSSQPQSFPCQQPYVHLSVANYLLSELFC